MRVRVRAYVCAHVYVHVYIVYNYCVAMLCVEIVT